MQSVYQFLIEPVGGRYNNEVDVDGKSLILNSENSNHEYTNRLARVVSCPKLNNTKISDGDEIIVHHNVFRRWNDVKGQEKNSKSYFSDGLYLVSQDQIFLIKKKEGCIAMQGFTFLQPLLNKDEFSSDKENPTVGKVVYSDGSFKEGEVLGYTPFSQYEFIIDKKRVYRVYNKFITTKYEYQGNKEEYNPSWA